MKPMYNVSREIKEKLDILEKLGRHQKKDLDGIVNDSIERLYDEYDEIEDSLVKRHAAVKEEKIYCDIVPENKVRIEEMKIGAVKDVSTLVNMAIAFQYSKIIPG